MQVFNDFNHKGGIDDSYSRLKTKDQKCSEEVMFLKEENEPLKKFKEEITLKQMERESHLRSLRRRLRRKQGRVVRRASITRCEDCRWQDV
jgi:hypothetical protein